MRSTSDFWGHWESNEIEWHIVGTPIEFKFKMIHDVINFFTTTLLPARQQRINDFRTYCIVNLEVKFASYLRNLGYKHNTVVSLDILDNNSICPVFNPINIHKWINNPNSFGVKWKYNISYLTKELVSPEFNYLTRFLYYGKYGTISEAEKCSVFPLAHFEV